MSTRNDKGALASLQLASSSGAQVAKKRRLILINCSYCDIQVKCHMSRTQSNPGRIFYTCDNHNTSATEICFLIDLNWVDGSSIFFDVIRVTLNLSLGQCKDQLTKGAKEFLDFVSSTCHIVNNAEPNICKVASDNFNDQVQKLVKLCRPAGLILSLYLSALYFKSNITFNQTVDMAAPYATILGSQKLEHLIATIEVLSSYFSEKGEDGNAVGLFLAYMDVLEFWFLVLLPCVEAGWRNFCSEGKDFLNWSNVFEVSEMQKLVKRFEASSFTLVNAWAKVLCKEYNDADKKYDAPTLYHLLTKSKDKNRWSRMSLGRIIYASNF